MGEAKRRQSSDANAKANQPLLPGLPITKQQSEQFIAITTKGAWIGIGALVLVWLTVRLIGPILGWWELAD
ncbi:DUF2839 domain-containing protein [Synechococcus elongatus]|uniref:DUF2839 domain-containing protein n=1 Tax=Synechococcus elongatus TaxID=32046 RepID=UPI000F7D6BF1|nr:DUF2839 domain-containing protein [Synechococcus elongatus]